MYLHYVITSSVLVFIVSGDVRPSHSVFKLPLNIFGIQRKRWLHPVLLLLYITDYSLIRVNKVWNQVFNKRVVLCWSEMFVWLYSTFAHVTKSHEGLRSAGSDGVDTTDSLPSVEKVAAVWWRICLETDKDMVSNLKLPWIEISFNVKIRSREMEEHLWPHGQLFISAALAEKIFAGLFIAQ